MLQFLLRRIHVPASIWMMEVNAIVVVFAAGEAAWMLTFPGPYKTSSLHWRRKAFLRLHLMFFIFFFLLIK